MKLKCESKTEDKRSGFLQVCYSPNPDKPELKIEDLLYRFALSSQYKSIAFLKY